MTSHIDHFRSPQVTWCHFLSRDSYYELQPCRKWNAQYTRVFGLLQPLAGDLRSSYNTSGSLPVTWGRETFSCHVTPSYCEHKPCRKWYVQYPRLSLLHALPSDFRWNDVTSWSLPVTWVHVTSFLVTWRRATAL